MRQKPSLRVRQLENPTASVSFDYFFMTSHIGKLSNNSFASQQTESIMQWEWNLQRRHQVWSCNLLQEQFWVMKVPRSKMLRKNLCLLHSCESLLSQAPLKELANIWIDAFTFKGLRVSLVRSVNAKEESRSDEENLIPEPPDIKATKPFSCEHNVHHFR